MAVLADKEQPLLGSVLFARKATARACLAGIMGIHLDAQRARQDRFIGEKAMQFRKRPLRGVLVGPALLLRSFLAPLAFRPFSDAIQLFQADESVGVRVQDVLDFSYGSYSASTASLAGR